MLTIPLEEEDDNPLPSYPCGLIVYLRTIYPPDGTLHRMPFPSGRDLVEESSDWFVVVDAEGVVLGRFVISAVSFIMPLSPEVPADANH